MEIDLPERLDGEVVALRRMRNGDAPAFAGAFLEDPDLGRLLGFDEDPTQEAVIERVAKAPVKATEGRAAEFSICAIEDEQFLGSMLLHSFAWEHLRCEVGFWVLPKMRGQGFAADALSLVLSWVFDELGIERMELTTTPDNAPTRALAARLGFAEEGLQRQRNIERGRRVDFVLFGLLAEDWVLAG